MCVILNFRDIYDKIIIEINSDNFDLYSKNTYLHYCVIEHIRLFKVSNINTALKYLKKKEFWISAFAASAKKDFTKHNWKGRNVLLFGSEGYGLKEKTLENSDFRFKININKNIESLNISNSVSIVCHHIAHFIGKND